MILDRFRTAFFLVSAAGSISFVWANSNQPLDRPFTLRNDEPFLLEGEFHRMIGSRQPRSLIFPRPCISQVDSSKVCSEDSVRLQIKDNARRRLLSLTPVAGFEYRYWDESVITPDVGAMVQGYSGPLSFYLDARMFTEFHEESGHPGYDREPVDKQDEEASGSFAYSSFSRYRSNLNYDFEWGRLTIGRDAIHWGPGLYSSLVFNQHAIPFNHLNFTTQIGPVNVQSLYGNLTTEEERVFNTQPHNRSVYGHRYEWNVFRDLLLGISEQLIVYEKEEPFAFIPVVPLFILKSDAWERLNNGSLAADFSWRIPGLATVYSEFLIDDMQAPSALFSDGWGNKWAWMAGSHWIWETRSWQAGGILEYSRIEPWTYTHYLSGTAQATNLGHPLGSQAGPNSQLVIAKAYLRREGWYISSQADCFWKGDDPGSSALDSPPQGLEKKAFLVGKRFPDFSFTPMAAWTRGDLSFQASLTYGKDIQGFLRTQFSYR